MRAPPVLSAIAVAASLSSLAACQGIAPPGEPPALREADERERQRFVRRRLEDARHFREQGRLEGAERAVRRALAVAPDHAPAHRLLARILEAQGRRSDAASHWQHADRIDPPPPPPPDSPLPLDSDGVLVALVTRQNARPGSDEADRAPHPDLEWSVVGGRLGARLPWAVVRRADPETVAGARALLESRGARAVISLRTDRAFCAYSRKDGDFALARLRVAAGTPGAPTPTPETVRELISDPPPGEACVRLVLARALERALRQPSVERALSETRRGEWSSATLRALFPGIGRRIAVEVERGRARLATGDVGEAVELFQAAVAIDPDDREARSYLREAEETLEIAIALAPDHDPSWAVLDFTFTPAERSIADALLAEERRRRDELLAALLINEVEERPPPPDAVATLRPVSIRNSRATGPSLARRHSEGPVEARALFDGDGRVVTTYYFARGGRQPLLREDDTDRDGRPDRWISYRGETRGALWEDRQGRGWPDVYVSFADGRDIDRIEIDLDGDGRPERVFRYADGRLASEGRDTNGDGALDRVETFDDSGRVTLLEEDLNGDGQIDVRSRFREGRLVSREIRDPRLVERFEGR